MNVFQDARRLAEVMATTAGRDAIVLSAAEPGTAWRVVIAGDVWPAGWVFATRVPPAEGSVLDKEYINEKALVAGHVASALEAIRRAESALATARALSDYWLGGQLDDGLPNAANAAFSLATAREQISTAAAGLV